MLKQIVNGALAPLGLKVVRIPRPLTVDDVLPQLIRAPEPVLFDVGANHGQTAKRLRETFPRGRIWCFEPQPHLAAEIDAIGDPLVTVEAAAVSDRPGTATLHLNSFDQAASLMAATVGGGYDTDVFAPTGKTTVPTVTIDIYCREHGIERIDYLKIDAQGFSREVLDGAADLLNCGGIHVVRAEVTFGDFYERSDSFAEIETRLKGFRLHTIIDTDDEHVGQGQGGAIDKANGALRYIDVIYVWE